MAEIEIEDVPVDAGEVRPEPDKARSTPKTSGKVKGLFGDNRKTRGGPRKLNRADVDKLAGIYALVGMGLAPVNPKLAGAFATAAEPCAEAWANWAEQNDAVRRAILWLIEGGAFGAVILAHMPIVVAAIPEDRLPPILSMFNGQAESGNGQAQPSPFDFQHGYQQ